MERLGVERTSLSREAYASLRSAILGLRIAPGSKLVVRPLSEVLGLSATPIREALMALEREGLATFVPRRGYFVPTFGIREVIEIYDLREALESLAARLVAKRTDTALVEHLQALLTEQHSNGNLEDLENYGDLDLAFHRAIWDASGNRRLVQTAQGFAGQLRLLMSSSAKVPSRSAASLEEHRQLVEMIEARKPAAASKVMGQHVRRAGKALIKHLQFSESASVSTLHTIESASPADLGTGEVQERDGKARER